MALFYCSNEALSSAIVEPAFAGCYCPLSARFSLGSTQLLFLLKLALLFQNQTPTTFRFTKELYSNSHYFVLKQTTMAVKQDTKSCSMDGEQDQGPHPEFKSDSNLTNNNLTSPNSTQSDTCSRQTSGDENETVNNESNGNDGRE